MRRNLVILAAMALLATAGGIAQEDHPSATAKALYEEGLKAFGNGLSGDPKELNHAVNLFRKAINVDPDYYQAQEEYILAYKTAAAPDIDSSDLAKERPAE